MIRQPIAIEMIELQPALVAFYDVKCGTRYPVYLKCCGKSLYKSGLARAQSSEKGDELPSLECAGNTAAE